MDGNFKHKKIRACLRNDQKRDMFNKLYKFCAKNNYLFCDKEFPPERTSLVSPDYNNVYNGDFDDVDWKRAADFFQGTKYRIFDEKIEPTDIVQGGLGDCYFLCALASLSENSSMITRLFDTDETNPYGIVSVWLNISGTWKNVVIDEYLPVTKEKKGYVQQLAFTTTQNNELWAILLEKAYAKAYGCYYSIIGGDPVHAMRDLTGAPYEHIKDFSNPDQTWQLLDKYSNRWYYFVAWMRAGNSTEEKTADGLVHGHAYSILEFATIKDKAGKPQRLIQLRNPWGTFEWTGDYSDNSPLWTPELKKQLKLESKDDGIFWMPYEKFIDNYEGIGVLKVEQDYIFNSGRFKRKNKADTVKLAKLSISAPTHCYISLDQMDAKEIDNPAYSYNYFRLTLGQLLPGEGIKWMNSICSPDRNIFLEMTRLDPGEYVLLIDCYWVCELAESFCITTYSKYPIEIVKLDEPATSLFTIEYLLWSSYVSQNLASIEKASANTVTVSKQSVKVQNYKAKLAGAMVTVYASKNESPAQPVVQVVKIVGINGYDIFARKYTGQEIVLNLDKGGVDFFMTKMNPNFDTFSLKQQVKSIAASTVKETVDLSVVKKLFDMKVSSG